MSAPGLLTAARYGKDLVKVARVVRHGDKHYFIEYTVKIMLEGEIESSYTKADNSCVVPTDTCRQTVLIFAKTSPYILNPALFALQLSLHMVNKYSHIHKCFIDLVSPKWTRIKVAGKDHTHSFVRDGDEKTVVSAYASEEYAGGKVTAGVTQGIKDLLVLKTTGSAFTNFHMCENTILQEVDDRIFSTSVEVMYKVPLPTSFPINLDNLEKLSKIIDFVKIQETCKTVTLETFATDESASVQATMYNTAQRLLKEVREISDVSYSYPNKHYIPVNLTPFKLENGLTRAGGAEVFYPASDPSGLITATISRVPSTPAKAKL